LAARKSGVRPDEGPFVPLRPGPRAEVMAAIERSRAR
jgi:hypothetical protein